MKAISSMATRHVLLELSEAARAAGHAPFTLEAMGGVTAEARVAAGDAYDLVFLALPAVRRLADAGWVRAETVTPLFISQLAAAVPGTSDDPARFDGGVAFSNAVALRDALRAATSIGYSTGPSGAALLALIDDWGLREELSDRLVQAEPGVPVAQLLAEGRVGIGFQQLSELSGHPRVRILGVLPRDCANDTVFAGAVAAGVADAGEGAADADAGVVAECGPVAEAKETLRFLSSAAVDEVKTAHCFAVPESGVQGAFSVI